MPPIVTRSFVMLFVGHLLQALGYSTMLLFPLYLDFLGASRAEIGAVMAAASVGGLAARPVIAWGLDVWGRKPVLVVGTLLLALGMLSVAAIDALGPGVYLMRLLIGVGTGTLFTGYFTLAGDVIPDQRRTEGLALFGISGLAPLVINAVAPGVGIAPPQLRWFFPVVGLVILSSLIPLAGVVEPPRTVESKAFSVGAVVQALRRPRLLPVWVATLVFAGMVAVFMAFATVAAQSRGLANPGLVWLTYAAGALSVRLFGARLPEQLGPSRVAAAALLCYSGAFVFAADAHSAGAFAWAGLLAGVGHGYCFPVLSGQVLARSPLALRGTAMAAFTGLWGVTRLVLAPAFGWLSDVSGDTFMLRAAAVYGLVGLVGWVALELRLGGEPAP
ncbi:MAG: MFS transporter [Proteobacteria bacterium]|nr:MFS transporter [Pseudomonadota bacterium]